MGRDGQHGSDGPAWRRDGLVFGAELSRGGSHAADSRAWGARSASKLPSTESQGCPVVAVAVRVDVAIGTGVAVKTFQAFAALHCAGHAAIAASWPPDNVDQIRRNYRFMV